MKSADVSQFLTAGRAAARGDGLWLRRATLSLSQTGCLGRCGPSNGEQTRWRHFVLRALLPPGKHCLAADFLPSLWGAPAKGTQPYLLTSKPLLLCPGWLLAGQLLNSSCPSRPAVPRCSVFQDDGSQKADGDVADAVPEAQETVQVIPGSKLLWRVNTRPPNSAQVRMLHTHPPASLGLSVPPVSPTPGQALQPFLCPVRTPPQAAVPEQGALCHWVGPCCRVSLRGLPALPEPS